MLYPNPTNKKKLQLQSELQLYIYDCMANDTKDTRGILEHKEPAISIVIPLDLRMPVSAKIYKYTYRELRGTHIPKDRNYYPSTRRFSLINFVRIAGLKCLSSLAFQLLFVAQLLSPRCSQ